MIANNATEVVSEGTVIGFGATTDAAIREMIEKAGFYISCEQANYIREERIYKQNIAHWTKELKLSATDSVKNNPIYISRIIYALAMNNYHLDNFNEAFGLMLQSAEAGNSQAEDGVAVMYSRGEGVEKDSHSAASWYEKAALQGQPEAMKKLGDYFYEGVGVEQSDAKAFQWWLKAAQDGFSPAYTSLAECYRDGLLGVKRNYKQAVVWYQKAANDSVGIYNMSYMYYNGYGVKRDYSRAFDLLFDIDTDQYYVQQSLGSHYYYGHGVKKDREKAIVHFSSFLDLIESEDINTRESCAKQIKEAQKIIKKYRHNSEILPIEHSN